MFSTFITLYVFFGLSLIVKRIDRAIRPIFADLKNCTVKDVLMFVIICNLCWVAPIGFVVRKVRLRLAK